MKLFCLAHAGGDSRYFDKFISYTRNKNIDIVPIEYNGRGKYKKEKIAESFDELQSEVLDKICMYISNEPYAIFGHSMGGLLAYEICASMLQKKVKLPIHLYISSRDEPKSPHSYIFSDNKLVERLLSIGDENSAIYLNKRFAKIYLYRIKEDFRLLQQYQCLKPIKLDIHTRIFWSKTDDTILTVIKNWDNYFTGVVEYKEFSGGHFYLNYHYKDVLDIIMKDCAGVE
ncbi:MAG: thioesterase domain-containing protein [Lachnoclostridium sp.]|nr:thioesterase domain-containing protein [Lachnospira sp.]MCM1248926.1 thioesterase domain-containing protein [Lachnoclostridium sp.]